MYLSLSLFPPPPPPSPHIGLALIESIVDNNDLNIEIDVQTGQLTLKSDQLAALDSEMMMDQDVLDVFGRTNMQCATKLDAQNLKHVRLLGRNSDIFYWRTPDNRVEPVEEEREYNPDEFSDDEKYVT